MYPAFLPDILISTLTLLVVHIWTFSIFWNSSNDIKPALDFLPSFSSFRKSSLFISMSWIRVVVFKQTRCHYDVVKLRVRSYRSRSLNLFFDLVWLKECYKNYCLKKERNNKPNNRSNIYRWGQEGSSCMGVVKASHTNQIKSTQCFGTSHKLHKQYEWCWK